MYKSYYRGFSIDLCQSVHGYAVFGSTGAVLCILPTIKSVMEYIDGLLS